MEEKEDQESNAEDKLESNETEAEDRQGNFFRRQS